MRVLLDECVDARLSRDLAGHAVRTVSQMGWNGIKNGDLLTRAQQHFDVMVTTDRNLSYQQNLGRFAIAVIVLCAPTNRLTDLKTLIPFLLAVLPTAVPGRAVEVRP